MKIFTGDRVGFLKEIEVERLKYHCLTRATGIQNEILNIRWWKKNSEDFITALTKSGTVELWDVNKRELKSLVLNIKKNPIGMEVLYSQNNKIITCSNEGIVEISNFDFDFDSELNPNLNLNDNLIDEKEIEFENKKKKIGIKKRKTRSKKLHFIENENLNENENQIEKMTAFQIKEPISQIRVDSIDQKLLSSGGNDNILKVYDIETGKCVFEGQNEPNDELDLPIPIWDRDHKWKTDSNQVIIVGTSYGDLRLYDRRLENNLVFSKKVLKRPLNAITVSRDNQSVYAGDTTGDIFRFDLRRGKNLGSFKGASGSIRAIEEHPVLDFVACVGLDRFVRIYDTVSRLPHSKLYLKQQLNSLLFTSQGKLILEENQKEKISSKSFSKNSHNNKTVDNLDKDLEDAWDNLPIADDVFPEGESSDSGSVHFSDDFSNDENEDENENENENYNLEDENEISSLDEDENENENDN